NHSPFTGTGGKGRTPFPPSLLYKLVTLSRFPAPVECGWVDNPSPFPPFVEGADHEEHPLGRPHPAPVPGARRPGRRGRAGESPGTAGRGVYLLRAVHPSEPVHLPRPRQGRPAGQEVPDPAGSPRTEEDRRPRDEERQRAERRERLRRCR